MRRKEKKFFHWANMGTRSERLRDFVGLSLCNLMHLVYKAAEIIKAKQEQKDEDNGGGRGRITLI